MDMLNAPFKKTDEFNFFNNQFRSLHERDSTYINNLVQQMEEGDRKFLKELFETKRITIEKDGVPQDVVRRIITVKKRGGVSSGAPNQHQQ
jgi:pimeloyl-CoA synthetase